MIKRRFSADSSGGLTAVIRLLRDDGHRLFGSGDILIEPQRFQVRESSEVARTRVTTPSEVRYIFAKVLKPRSAEASAMIATRERLRKDFEVTRHVFEAMKATDDLRAVEALVCYDDLLGVVTSEAPGLPLDVLVTRAARWPVMRTALAELESGLARVGRWVALFQQVAPGADPSRMSLDATREYLDLRLQRLTQLPRAEFGEDDRRSLLAYFDRRAADVSDDDLIDVPVHGDITPSNIVMAPDRVTVLDFAMTARGSRYLDIARLYTQLDFYQAKPQYRPNVIHRLQAAALSGFDAQLSPHHPLFEICTLQHVVCHFLSHVRQPGRFPRSLYSRHQCRLHRRWLRDKSRVTGGPKRATLSQAARQPR